MGAGAAIGWSLFALLFIFMFAVVLYLLLVQPDIQTLDSNLVPETSPDTPVPPLYRCTSDNDCGDKYTCDQSLGLCRIQNGQPCDDASDCLTNSYCSGICIDNSVPPNIDGGGIGSPCPCGTGYSCIQRSSDEFNCYLNSGQSCTDNADCVSGLCINSVCANTKEVGYSCENSSECSSNNCQLDINSCNPDTDPDCDDPVKVCQPVNVESGNVGAYCGDTVDTEELISCKDEGTLSCNATTNRCSNNNALYGEVCNDLFQCGDRFTCYAIPTYQQINPINCGNETIDAGYNGVLALCGDVGATGNNCQCLFNYETTPTFGPTYPNPNFLTEPSINNCISNFTAVDSICYADTQQFCNNNSDCSSNSCNSTGQVYMMNPSVSKFTPSEGDIGSTGPEQPDRNYPLTGLDSMSNISYDPLVTITGMNLDKLLGYTLDMQFYSETPTNEKEYLYGLADGILYRYDSVSMIFIDMGLVSGNITKILNADATAINSIEYMIIAAESELTNSVEFYIVSNPSTTPTLIPLNGSPAGLTSVQSLSVIGRANSEFDYLISSEDTLYYNGMMLSPTISGLNYTYNNGGRKFTLYNPDFTSIKMSFGIDSNGIDLGESYALITYKSTDSNQMLFRFTDPIDKTVTSNTFSDIKYPVVQYTNLSLCTTSFKIGNFTVTNVDPKYCKYLGMMLSSTITIDSNPTQTLRTFYISNGNQQVIPGYPNSDTIFMLTAAQAYIYSPKSCN